MSSSSKTRIILLALAGLVAGVVLSLSLNNSDPQKSGPQDSNTTTTSPTNIPGLLWPNPKQITAFQLIDQNTGNFNLENLKGHWSMLFFGYTHCPDICPTTMSLLNSVTKNLAESKDAIPQVIFVTIDPLRDTQQHLTDYISYFNAEFYGLTGSEENISSLTQQLGILSIKIPAENSEDVTDYLMDHSSSILLLDPQARLVGIFSAPHDATEIKQRYLAIRTFIDQQL